MFELVYLHHMRKTSIKFENYYFRYFCLIIFFVAHLIRSIIQAIAIHLHPFSLLSPVIFNISICFSEITGPIETKSGRLRVMLSHATFNNISAISWRSVLLVEETGVHGKIHRPVASHRHNLVRIFIGWSNTKFMLFVPIRN